MHQARPTCALEVACNDGVGGVQALKVWQHTAKCSSLACGITCEGVIHIPVCHTAMGKSVGLNLYAFEFALKGRMRLAHGSSCCSVRHY